MCNMFSNDYRKFSVENLFLNCNFFQVKNVLVEHAFEVSSFLFFVGPMTLICVLYVLIGIKLRKSKLLQGVKRRSCEFGRGITGQTRVIRMLSTFSKSHINNAIPVFYIQVLQEYWTGYRKFIVLCNSCCCCGIFPVLGTVSCTTYYGCLWKSYTNQKRSIP